MNKIKILPKTLADKIAAGEVVERPASVVKELVENALDARSKNVEIQLEEAGRRLIKVSDDGEGMGQEDLKLSYQRHATSKLYSDSDLNNISTLGFRGEALSSIAAVSFLTISSRSENASSGWGLDIEAGKPKKDIYPIARTVGTSVEIRNLFFNTPARLKFLKSNTTEMFHNIRIVTELCLAYTGAAFKLCHNKAEIINLPQKHTLLERIRILLGDELADNLVEIGFETSGFRISGFISKPGFGFSNRQNQYVFVNNRPVTNKTINHAIMQGYHTFIGNGQFPPVVIFIQTSPESIDVNVHPTKREIRFRDGAVIHDLLLNTIKKALTNKEYLPKWGNKGDIKFIEPENRYEKDLAKQFPGSYAPELLEKELFSVSLKDRQRMFDDSITTKTPYLQIDNTYLIGQDTEGVIIIDQHAAHERIIFDELLSQFKNKKLEKQLLLLPVTLHLNKAQMMLIRENKTLFLDLGFDIEEFGPDTFAAHSYPACLGKVDILSMLQNVLADIIKIEFNADMEERITQLLAPIACHSAVRANERLTPGQIISLTDRLWMTEAPYTCPHGRPTLIKINWNELKKRFKRK